MTLELDALVVPAFDDLAGLPGEARPWRERYNLDRSLDIEGVPTPVRHGDALGVVPTGIGKTAAATTMTALLASDRLAVDGALVLSVGVAGGPPSLGIGSVVVADTILDWDDKCRFDPEPDETPLARNPYTEGQGVFDLDPALVERARESAAGVELRAPDLPEKQESQPSVVTGTNVCGDELWHGRQVAQQVAWLASEYDAGPYCATEMEDAGTAAALARFDRLDDYLSIRAISNHDRPAPGTPPRESFFGSAFEAGFEPAVENAVAVAQAVVDNRL
jgi:purine nucleoside permease